MENIDQAPQQKAKQAAPMDETGIKKQAKDNIGTTRNDKIGMQQ